MQLKNIRVLLAIIFVELLVIASMGCQLTISRPNSWDAPATPPPVSPTQWNEPTVPNEYDHWR
jgi:hypothetical protein